MLKYVNTGVVFQEIPDEITLSINISNCPCRCPGCHSTYLWCDVGEPLTPEALDGLIEKYGNDITCICFMGGDADPQSVIQMACYLRLHYPQFKIGWYSGRIRIPSIIRKEHFDYIKIGPYIAHLGGLKERTTNQRLYKRVDKADFVDITSAFWKK